MLHVFQVRGIIVELGDDHVGVDEMITLLTIACCEGSSQEVDIVEEKIGRNV